MVTTGIFSSRTDEWKNAWRRMKLDTINEMKRMLYKLKWHCQSFAGKECDFCVFANWCGVDEEGTHQACPETWEDEDIDGLTISENERVIFALYDENMPIGVFCTARSAYEFIESASVDFKHPQVRKMKESEYFKELYKEDK